MNRLCDGNNIYQCLTKGGGGGGGIFIALTHVTLLMLLYGCIFSACSCAWGRWEGGGDSIEFRLIAL